MSNCITCCKQHKCIPLNCNATSTHTSTQWPIFVQEDQLPRHTVQMLMKTISNTLYCVIEIIFYYRDIPLQILRRCWKCLEDAIQWTRSTVDHNWSLVHGQKSPIVDFTMYWLDLMIWLCPVFWFKIIAIDDTKQVFSNLFSFTHFPLKLLRKKMIEFGKLLRFFWIFHSSFTHLPIMKDQMIYFWKNLLLDTLL